MFDKPNTSIDGLMEPQYSEPGDTGIRLFFTTPGESFLGLQMGESPDSFLVFFPSRLLANEDKRLIEPFMMVPYFRLLKSAVTLIVPAYGEFEYFYTEYLATKTSYLYPNFENEFPGHLEVLKDAYEALKSRKQTSATLISREDLQTSAAPSEQETEEVVYVAPNASKYKH